MKVRTLSAIVLILIVAPFIYIGGVFFALAIGLVSVLGFKEIIDLKSKEKNIPLLPTILALISCLLLVYSNFTSSDYVYFLTFQRIIFMIFSLLIPTLIYKDNKYTMKDAFYLIGLILFIGIGLNSFIIIRNNGLFLFLFLLLIPVCTDTFAMVIGSLIGKHKMCPTISPKKSWEGFFAGLVAGTIIPAIFYNFLIDPINIKIVIGIMFLSCMGQVGDLIFSKIKREAGIKDFSNLIPGHGGVLDRIDSMIVIFLSFIFVASILF